MTKEELIEYIKWAVDDLVASIARLACETEEGKKLAATLLLALNDFKILIAANESDD